MPSLEDAAVYEGAVTHRRFRPVAHFLKYRVFSFLLDLDHLDATSRRLRLFSINKFNLFSFFDRDHFPDREQGLAAYVRGELAARGLDGRGKITLLCYPRMLGYAFNPLAVYFCHDSAGALSAIIYEVRNTFGERHAYLFAASGLVDGAPHGVEKRLHVSPFNDMRMRYRFRTSAPRARVSLVIDTDDSSGTVLNAAFSGRRAQVSDRKLLALFARYPLMTVKVIAGIHVEAAKLLAKGVRLKKGASAPGEPITFVPARAGSFVDAA